MLVYVLFAILPYGSTGVTSFTYEFKDKIQCESAATNLRARFSATNFESKLIYCQEVSK